MRTIKKRFTRKTITIRTDQAEMVRKKSMNLSRFVQQRLDEVATR